VHVPQRRPVTIVIRGDDLPERGTLRWAGPGGEYFRGFWCKRHGATAVVTRAFARDHAEMWAGGYDEGAPVVIRLSDLPPAPRDPLLDLAVLDRHTRRRASVVLASSTDSVVRGLAVRPAWQAEGLWHDQDLMSFQRRVGGKVWQLFHADNKGWSLWARDDHAYELRVTASGHQPAKVTLPARDPAAAEPPELAITLTER